MSNVVNFSDFVGDRVVSFVTAAGIINGKIIDSTTLNNEFALILKDCRILSLPNYQVTFIPDELCLFLSSVIAASYQDIESILLSNR